MRRNLYHTYKLRWSSCYLCTRGRERTISYSTCKGNYRFSLRQHGISGGLSWSSKVVPVGGTLHFVCDHNQPGFVKVLARATWEGPWRRNKEREAMISLGWKETITNGY